MPPKKKAPQPEAPPPPVEAPDDQPAEEEEEGPGKAAFFLEAEGARDLPCSLETVVHFSGVCRSNRSSPAAASTAPSAWELPKPKFVRACNQELFDDLADRELTVQLRDAAADDAIIGTAALDLAPLLHNRTEVGGELELKLTPEYFKKWFPEPEQEEVPDTKSTRKDKKMSKAEKAAAPPPPPVEVPVEVRSQTPAEPFIPPASKILVRVRVQELVAPAEDRSSWTLLTLGIKGVFALPESLSSLGLNSPEDPVELHPLRYRGAVLGESLGDGVLTKPPQAEPVSPSGGEGGLAAGLDSSGPQEEELSEERWRELKELHGFSVKFKNGERMRRYRGADFVKEFRRMLNETGGVWFYFVPSHDAEAKKEAKDAAAFYKAKAWLDLRPLSLRGETRVQACCGLIPAEEPPAGVALPSLQDSRTFVRLSLELSHDLTPPEHPSLRVAIDTLVPKHEGVNKFPDSGMSEKMYREALEKTVEVMCQDCALGVKGGTAGVIEAMKKSGSHADVKEHLRRTMISVLRERLRKDTRIVPGKPLGDEMRNELALAYVYLTGTAAHVLDDLRQKQPVPPLAEPAPLAESPRPLRRVPSKIVARASSSLEVAEPPRPVYGSKEALCPSTPEGELSPAEGSSQELPHVLPGSPGMQVGAALAETAPASRARQALGEAHDDGERYSRLAFEAEMVGRYDRAARMLQNRLLLEEFKHEPKEWIAYAKFCARARGRQAAAEEALRQAVQLLAEGAAEQTEETAKEVDLMLACLLLDRGRHDEAIRVFRVWHEKDIADGSCSFFLGLAVFLSGDAESARPLLESVDKPHEWFVDAQDDVAVEAKLQAERAESPPPVPKPYAACLERMLEFGLPSLVFTFLDQCGTLSEEELGREPIALIDARASFIDRDFTACSTRLERLLVSGSATREAWRLAGECYLQLQDMDRALQAFNNAMAFENKFDDPVVYVHLGSVLLAKKRWKSASSMFLRSLQFKPTAEAWTGLAVAEYRADELQACYEALCEANLLDNERPDVWAQLTLVHLRFENWDLADGCFRQCLACSPDCDDLLLEVAAEYRRHERQPDFAEAAIREVEKRRLTTSTAETPPWSSRAQQ